MPVLTDSKTEKVAQIIRRFHQPEIKKLLVVGCGSGIEAAILAQQLNAEVTGIDVQENFNAEAAQFARLEKGDAESLRFDDETFDFVFSYHALEHIENPLKALQEINRVLKTGGGFWIGTPNKSRIVGYIGGKETSFREKIRWNIADWKDRLHGRFENALGAHAGFTSKELHALLHANFSTVEEMTETYFSEIYQNRQSLINLIASSGVSRFIYPSVYFGGSK